MEDHQNGSYSVNWMPPAPGQYTISVHFMGTFGGVAGEVRGSPVTACFRRGQPAENNLFTGPAMIRAIATDIGALTRFVDKVSYTLGTAHHADQTGPGRTRCDV